jgi:hypothetical protein
LSGWTLVTSITGMNTLICAKLPVERIRRSKKRGVNFFITSGLGELHKGQKY